CRGGWEGAPLAQVLAAVFQRLLTPSPFRHIPGRMSQYRLGRIAVSRPGELGRHRTDHGGQALAPMALCSTTARCRGGRGVLARLLVLVPLLAMLGGCGLWNDMFGDKEEMLPDLPADRLYNEGVYLMNEKKDYKESAKKFEEVDRQHPYSEWAR